MLKVLTRKKTNKAQEQNKFIALMGSALSKHSNELSAKKPNRLPKVQ